MHLRKLVLACGFASFALANYASALGLGEVKLKSTLNQPLDAEVQLLDTRDLTAEQILVALGSPADFERNGVDRLYFYTEFQFEVVLNNPGGAIVRITTNNPVREPYLNFLLEARWTAGRLLREYTVLMDLPTFDEAAPQAVQAPEKSAPAVVSAAPISNVAPINNVAPVNNPVVNESAPATTDQAPTETVAEKSVTNAEQGRPAKKFDTAAGTYGPIHEGDTLWQIALSARPDSSVSVYQTMLALQRLNPDVFIRNNINLIKKGQVLRLPDASDIASVSNKEAIAQVNTQNSAWSNMVANTPSSGLGAQLDATRNTSTGHRQYDTVEGRVKLEAPSSANNAANGQGSGSNKGAGKGLEKELATTLEELDKAKSENTELSSRVNDLENQTKTMQRLVDVSNDKLRAMQLNAGKKTSSASQAAVASVVQSSAVSSQAEAVSSAAASSKKPIIKPPVVVAPEPSIVDQIMDNISYIALGLLGLIVLVIMMVRRKKSQEEANAARNRSDDLFSSEPSFDSFDQYQHDTSLDDEMEEESAYEEEEAPAVAETGDVVGEADIYIAYGKYDQAEEMLLNGLSKDPSSTEIRLKLLEVYSQTQNAAAFDKHYNSLLANGTPGALSRAAELRANIVGAAEFSNSAPTAKPSAVASVQKPPVPKPIVATANALDIDLDLDEDLSKKVSAPVSSEKFNIDLSDRPIVAPPSVGTALDDDDFALDLDLDEPAKHHIDAEAEAEDLSHISLALDEMDHGGLEHDDIDISSEEPEDEFSFDFNELDDDADLHDHEVEKAPIASLKEDKEDLNDDFNLEMDVDDVDLAALDKEMANLDAELNSSDDTDVEDTDSSFDLDDEPIAEPVESTPTKTRTFAKVKEEPAEVHEDDVFNEALSGFTDTALNAQDAQDMSEEDMDAELDFMADADEAATKLDLARAYIDMGDSVGARDILAEVAHEGNEQQRQEAVELLSRIDD